MIDNYDSFVHNLARYFEQCDAPCEIHRNDQITISDIKDMKPEAIILSPGPCTPEEAGICINTIKEFGEHTPILGVCLGHQAICDAYGGQTKQSDTPIHGKSSTINHNKKGIFKNIPTPLKVGRYHSLICELPDNNTLETTATLDDKTAMGILHKTYPVYGVQFHPESILTQHGLDIIQNFVNIAETWNKAKAA